MLRHFFGISTSVFLAFLSLSAFAERTALAEAPASGATGGARFFAGRAPSGVFFGVFGTALSASASANGSSASVSGFAYEAGGMLGYTFIIGRVFDLSLGGGAAYAHEQLSLNDAGNSLTAGSNGVVPALRLSLGVAF